MVIYETILMVFMRHVPKLASESTTRSVVQILDFILKIMQSLDTQKSNISN